MDFPARILAIRKQMRLSQEKFGELFNVSQRTVAAWEAGDRLPSLSALEDLAQRLAVSVDYLLGRESSAQKEPAALSDDELRESVISRIQSLPDPAVVRVSDFLDGLEAGRGISAAAPAAPGSASPPGG